MAIDTRIRYQRDGSAKDRARVVVLMPKAELAAIDEWGIPTGMANRTQAIRHLLKKGLQFVEAEAGKTGDGVAEQWP